MALGVSLTEVRANPPMNWVRRDVPPPSASLSAVHHANGLWVAVGSGGTIVTSADGANWTHQESGTDQYLSGVHHAGAMWLVVGAKGTIRSLADGQNWTRQPSAMKAQPLDVHYANGLWVVVGEDYQGEWPPGGILLTSADGHSWQPRYRDPVRALRKVHHAQGLWLAVGTDGLVVRSTDGKTWNAIPTDGETDFDRTIHLGSG